MTQWLLCPDYFFFVEQTIFGEWWFHVTLFPKGKHDDAFIKTIIKIWIYKMGRRAAVIKAWVGCVEIDLMKVWHI